MATHIRTALLGARLAARVLKIRPTRRDLRLWSGLILFFYVAAHLVNHALGLISIAVAERGLRVAVGVWQSPLGTLVLYGAAATHIALAFSALYRHRTLRMPALELLRIALGLSIPTLLIAHAVGTRLAFERYGHPPDYAHVVWMLWHSGREGRQIALLVPGWMHGCLGINFAFGKRAAYLRFRLALFGAALLLPAFAVLGFLAMLKEVSLSAQDPAWVAATIVPLDDAQHLALGHLRDGLLALYAGAIGAVFIARAARAFVEERRGSLVSIGYPDRSVRVPRGWSVLEASRSHHIAHISMCGGRARCSTCRVRVVAGQDQCPPPTGEERRTLARVHAAQDTRLACQLRPLGNIAVVPLLTAAPRTAWEPAGDGHRTPRAGLRPVRRPWGNKAGGKAAFPCEREAAVMLVDLRWRHAQRRLLPHDLLYALHRFSETVGGITRAAGGLPMQFMGDRVTVLFGLEVVPLEANRQALLAALALDASLAALCTQLQCELGCETGHVIHLHTGRVAIGETGDRLTRSLTAAGSAIDVVWQLAAIGEPCAARHGAQHVAPHAAQHAAPRQDGPDDRRIVVSRPVWMAAQRDLQAVVWQERELTGGTRVEIARLDAAGVASPVWRYPALE